MISEIINLHGQSHAIMIVHRAVYVKKEAITMETTVTKTFRHDHFGDLTVLEIDGELWFIGKEAATRLGYANTRDALDRHVYPQYKRVLSIHETQKSRITTFASPRGLTVIKEAGLYQLAFKSKLPSAVEFTCWVVDEVLPSIRKTGTYTAPKISPLAASFSADVILPLLNAENIKVEVIKQNMRMKSYIGMQVFTVKDAARFFKVRRNVIYTLLPSLREGLDYMHLHGATAKRFKLDNPRLARSTTALYIISISGIIALGRLLVELAQAAATKRLR